MLKRNLHKYTVHHDNVIIHLDTVKNVREYIKRLEDSCDSEDSCELDVIVYKHLCVFDYKKNDLYDNI